MNSDPDAADPSNSGEMDALVAALRRDLPSERDSVRLRARLSALGLAASEAFVSSTAAASTSLAQGGAALGSAGEVAVQVGGVSWALKASAVAVVSATAIVGPAWYVHDRASSVAPAASAATVAAKARGDAAAARPRRASDARAEAPATPSDGEAATGTTRERAAAPLGAAIAQTSPTRGATSATGEARVQTGTSSTAAFAENSQATDATLGARAVEATTLREETALIDRALSALRASDTQRATALLAEHERRFPNGLLAQERERAQRKLTEMAEGTR
jgi:hypothetical protein